jgi:hypothetical protein
VRADVKRGNPFALGSTQLGFRSKHIFKEHAISSRAGISRQNPGGEILYVVDKNNIQNRPDLVAEGK